MDTRTGLPVVGMVGGGQLARMTHQAAISLGQSLRVLSARPDDSAALVAADVPIGTHTDLAALREFAKGCDAVTFDHEHVPTEHVEALEAEGVKIFPGSKALVFAQDKGMMRERLAALGAPVPRWSRVSTADEIEAFAGGAWPVVAKSTRGGYDGRGVWMVGSREAAEDLVSTGIPLIVEEKVPLRRELAALVARSPFGQVAAYPVVETVQRDGICVEVVAPAPGLSEERALAAQQLAIDLATELGVVGLLAVELFETGDGIVVNELAMRPHNSGHWTIEGARTSQFEQHLRAVLDYPMGSTALAAPVVVMANVLGGEDGGISIDERLHHLFAEDPGARVHLYGKQVRPGRKIGHVTVLGDDLASVRARAARAAQWLQEGK
ncbi:phosphoribosylaminoimidazole carboxylase [Actinoplanes sp. SE50]|uniref:5-(carboxyamino)imidazole ribonucleotide synthase n=1 Tax=unclassified Actinoplanes TaxID=2626549 RepID=UPI00023EC1F8|nr:MULTISPECIES: 5-(carboxyamino)imidazole ribonucleotide synthase [unclassified Actinoplanes]AEV81872.1 5-(carboxyamino)imidazole ribonucleotide synthase [Actinoplanes sp. SE50/110]ATO80273.1 phosphoribosylaminoimidazole carboxylase [Actinoplanes sp. SE50]SLL97678.1 5-(carboxyamino)imidazole ribonucleotide synthase [Actinoplanes sp. SE50/110]